MEPTQNINGISYNLWQPEALINTKILADAKITSNWNYRQYIQKNANNIMKYNTMGAIYSSGNNPYTIKNTEATNKSPYLYNSLYDNNNPTYGFKNSDLKQDYMNKETMNGRMISPSIPTNF
jgi:hypothetical protein